MRNEPVIPTLPTGPSFTVTAEDIPATFFGLSDYASPVAPAPRIDRRSALQVPAVKRARDLIAGTLATLPIDLYGPQNTQSVSALLDQPERGIPRSVTLARTYTDLLFDGVAWWYIPADGFAWHGYPVSVKRLDPRSVSVSQVGNVVYTPKGNSGYAIEYLEEDRLIRFDSPNEPLLIAGARAIRTCLELDAAAAAYAQGRPPMDWFTASDGIDPGNDPDVTDFLTDWQQAREQRTTGYVPAGLKYNRDGFNPEQLQLAQARQHAVLEIARVAGVDAEDLGVSTTSRSYFNAQDRARQFIERTLRGYAVAVEERLSQTDVTPRGYHARTNFSDLLRTDDATRMSIAVQGAQNGVLSASEARAYWDSTLPASASQDSPGALPTAQETADA